MFFRMSQMPPLLHWDRSEQFSYEKSEVVKWLMDRPEIFEWIFVKAKSLKAIKFDGVKWVGVNYEPEPLAEPKAVSE